MTADPSPIEQQADSWLTLLRTSLAELVQRHASSDGVVSGNRVPFAEWASLDAQEYESARHSVEPSIVKLRVLARRIGERRGRVVALAWSIPVAILMAALALALLLGVGR